MRYTVSLMMMLFLAWGKAPDAVPFVSPVKFSGLWYEIARTYNSYQEDCVASSVEYILDDDNEYTVYNRCFDKEIGGDLIEYKGVAEPAKGSSMSHIDMTYYWVFSRAFRVIYLSEDYQTAVMCDSDMDSLWIMHRKPQMEPFKLEKITAMLAKSMDLSRLIYTPQDAQGRYK